MLSISCLCTRACMLTHTRTCTCTHTNSLPFSPFFFVPLSSQSCSSFSCLSSSSPFYYFLSQAISLWVLFDLSSPFFSPSLLSSLPLSEVPPSTVFPLPHPMCVSHFYTVFLLFVFYV